jgi:phosphoglycolate phosphatase
MSLAIESLILDLDGTLLDSKPGILQSFARAVATVLPDAPFDIAKVAVGPPIRQMCKASFPAASVAQLQSLAEAYRTHYDREGCLQTRLFEGAINILTRCRQQKIPVDVATNKPKGVTTSIFGHLKIGRFFREVVNVDSTDPPFSGKAAMIRHLLQLNRLNPRQTIFVGDTAEDAAAATACATPFVWAAYGYGHLAKKERKSVFKTINRLEELRDILSK